MNKNSISAGLVPSKSIFMSNPDVIHPDDSIEVQFEKAKLQKELEEANAIFMEAQKAKQEEINKKLQTLELLPMYNKVIILKYPENPYKKVVEGNIIVDYSGLFKNPDSGELDNLKELVACAKVIEVGPDVTYLKAGDDVYYDTRTCYPVPFMSLGYLLTSEPQILCVLNEGLKERFKMK